MELALAREVAEAFENLTPEERLVQAVRTVGVLRASPSTGWQQVARAEARLWEVVTQYEAAQQGNTRRLVTRDDAPVAPTPAT